MNERTWFHKQEGVVCWTEGLLVGYRKRVMCFEELAKGCVETESTDSRLHLIGGTGRWLYLWMLYSAVCRDSGQMNRWTGPDLTWTGEVACNSSFTSGAWLDGTRCKCCAAPEYNTEDKLAELTARDAPNNHSGVKMCDERWWDVRNCSRADGLRELYHILVQAKDHSSHLWFVMLFVYKIKASTTNVRREYAVYR